MYEGGYWMIENKPAGFWIRFLAIFIDSLFVSLLTWLVAALITGEVEQLQQTQQQTETNAEELSSSIYSVFFIILFTASRFKGSPGKMICKIQVTNEDGSTISILKSLGSLLCLYPLRIDFNDRIHDGGMDGKKKGPS